MAGIEAPIDKERGKDRRPCAGFFPGSGVPGLIAYPDPSVVGEVIEDARVVDLTTLIQRKLAARRYQDFADVVALVRVHELDEGFASRLDESVRRD
jgi:hypothetical protein